MKLLYEGKEIGTIVTNHSMTIDEALKLLGIDISEMADPNTPAWDYELFEMDYESEIHAAAAALGRKGGKSTSQAKKASSAANGRKGGRPMRYQVAIDVHGAYKFTYAATEKSAKKLLNENGGETAGVIYGPGEWLPDYD